MAAASEDEVDEVEVVDGSEVGAAGLVLPAVRVEVHVAQRSEPRGRHGHPSLSRESGFYHHVDANMQMFYSFDIGTLYLFSAVILWVQAQSVEWAILHT